MGIAEDDIIFPQEIQFWGNTEQQRAMQPECRLGKGIPYPLVPSSLFPFCVPDGVTGVVKLICDGGTEIAELPVSLIPTEDGYSYYDGNQELDVSEGVYYLDIGGYFSDLFQVFDESRTGDRISCVAYRDDGAVGRFVYPQDYYNKIWLDGHFRKPAYTLVREAKLDGDDNPFYSSQRWEKRIAIDVTVTEPTVDAITVLPLHSDISITTRGVEYEGLSDAVFDEPEWDDTLSCVANVGVSFCSQKIIKRLCGDVGLIIPEPPEPPELPVQKYQIFFTPTRDCDSSANIIPGATIVVSASGFERRQVNNYLFSLAAGTYSFTITHPEYETVSNQQLIVTDTDKTVCVMMMFSGVELGQYYEKYGGVVVGVYSDYLFILGAYDLNGGQKMQQGAASVFASAYNGGGFFDWYLPTVDEMSDVFQMGGGGTGGDWYWTSTPGDSGGGVMINMGSGSASEAPQTAFAYGRATRKHMV